MSILGVAGRISQLRLPPGVITSTQYHVCPKHCRCIAPVLAPDLIGTGESEKLPGEGFDGRYSFQNHSAYLDPFLKEMKIGCNVRWVVLDCNWGSGLGLDWISRNLKCVKSFAFMGAVIGPEPLAELPFMDAMIFKHVIRNPVLRFWARGRLSCISSTCTR